VFVVSCTPSGILCEAQRTPIEERYMLVFESPAGVEPMCWAVFLVGFPVEGQLFKLDYSRYGERLLPDFYAELHG
jgi:hypothetical protein